MMNWNDDNDVIYLSSSSYSLPSSPRHPPKRVASSTSVVPTSVEDDSPIGKRSDLPRPVRGILSDAQLNLPVVAGPSVPADPLIAYTARVLEIVPDVEPAHLRTLLEKHTAGSEDVVQHVLHALFEDPTYPRVAKPGKRKRSPDDDDGREKAKLKLDYTSKDREFLGGRDYAELALSQLLEDFPLIPKPHVRVTLKAHKGLYAPTHLFLAHEAVSDRLPYIKKTIPSRVTGKSKWHDVEFEKERAWLVDYLMHKEFKETAEPETKGDDYSDDDEECEDGLECGCCFSKFAFDKMVQCAEAHLFCRACCRSYAASQLGQHDHRLRCMDQSGCKEFFPESELARFLPEKLLALYHRLKQQKEIAAAGLEGLEECPFCEYKVVIENPDEKLFRCESADCGAVSCRSCKKPDHLPKSCKEAEKDQHLNIRHAIEEAMTKALMRNCPKCNKGFVKENGCNKMTCPNCQTISCYNCREVIVGYEHFDKAPPNTVPANPNLCSLWDLVAQEQRHHNEVTAAAKKATEEYKAAHPDVPDEVLEVDLPAAPVALPAPLQPVQPPVNWDAHMRAARMHIARAAHMQQAAQAAQLQAAAQLQLQAAQIQQMRMQQPPRLQIPMQAVQMQAIAHAQRRVQPPRMQQRNGLPNLPPPNVLPLHLQAVHMGMMGPPPAQRRRRR